MSSTNVATRNKQHATSVATSSHAPRPTPHAPSVGSEVFSINFIRHEFLPPHVRHRLLAAGAGWLCVNAVVLAWLMGMTVLLHERSGQLRASVTEQMASAVAVGGVAEEMDTLRERASEQLAQLNAIIARETQRFPVAGKLAGLSRTLPPRTWLTNLSGDRDGRSIRIQVAYLIHPESPYDLPTKAWLAALKEDAAFGAGLTRLEMGQSSRKRVGEAELFLCDLIAEWQTTGLRGGQP